MGKTKGFTQSSTLFTGCNCEYSESLVQWNETLMMMVFHQSVELEKMRAELEQERKVSRIDPLTQTYRKENLERLWRESSKRASRNDNELTIGVIDLDRFRSFNNEYGHQIGDAVLSGFGEILMRNRRETDHVIRTGGDEFLIIFECDAEGAFTNLTNLQMKMKEHMHVDVQGQRLYPTASFGVAEWDRVESLDILCSRADKALYAAKEIGRNCICIA